MVLRWVFHKLKDLMGFEITHMRSTNIKGGWVGVELFFKFNNGWNHTGNYIIRRCKYMNNPSIYIYIFYIIHYKKYIPI